MIQQNSEARERVLAEAERLFSERGYSAVTMRDVATALEMRQASLYHHVPGGKEQLFVEVTERSMQRHEEGLRQALAMAGPDLRAQLRGAAEWLLSQPPVDLVRLFRHDLPAVAEAQGYRLTKIVYTALIAPIEGALSQAYAQGEIRLVDAQVLAVSFLSVIETLHDMQRYTSTPKQALASDMIDVFLDGLRRR